MGYTPHVLVVGGGAVGTGIARDLALRGLEVTLVEQGQLTAGATGRMQGILYSGARFADSDPAIADQCAAERRTLGDIAGHCIDQTGGLLVPADGDTALDAPLAACRECDVDVEEVSGDEARVLEPALSADVERALRVPDAVIDPFRLTVANAKGAQAYGADIRPHTAVTDVVVEDGAVAGVELHHDPPGREPGENDGENGDDSAYERTGVPSRSPGAPGYPPDDEGSGVPGGGNTDDPVVEDGELRPDYVVNAAGGWAGEVAAMAGLEVPLEFTKGAMAVAQGVEMETVVTGWGSGERRTAVPQGGTCLLGATSEEANGPGDDSGEQRAVEGLFDDLAGVVPELEGARPLRSYRGVRPSLPGSPAAEFAVLDHGRRDDRWGMTTVVGGTLTTHRLVAQRVCDQVCREFGITRECLTATEPLPGHGEQGRLDGAMDEFGVQSPLPGRGRNRAGGRGPPPDVEGPDPIVCECEAVTRGEIRAALADETGTPTDLNDVRIRTWASMGECQGGRCVHRMAAELHPDHDADVAAAALEELFAERWKGHRDALWGDSLTEAMRTYGFHAATTNRGSPPGEDVDLAAFDKGPGWGETGPDVGGGGRL